MQERAGKRRHSIYYKLLGRTYLKEDTLVGWMFLLPAVVLGVTFILLPMIISLSYAFTDANLLKLSKVKWIGFSNFVTLFKDKIALEALTHSLEFVIKVVPIQLVTSLGLALILNSKLRGNTFFRWAFFCPVMLSLAVTSFLWMNLLNKDYGLVNAMLEAMGMKAQPFLSSPKQAMNVIVFVSVWQGAGYQMLIFLSGLKNIPQELYEAAGVDGASGGQKFFYITLPSIKPTFSFVLITMLIGAFRLMVQPMIMTGGGPQGSTLTVSYYIYQQGITYRQVGYSSAIAMAYTILISAVALTLRKVLGDDKTV